MCVSGSQGHLGGIVYWPHPVLVGAGRNQYEFISALQLAYTVNKPTAQSDFPQGFICKQ